MPDPIACLLAVLAAAGASASLVLAVGWPRRAAPVWMNAVCILGSGLGMVVGCNLLQLRPAWPPGSALDRFLTIVLPAAVAVELAANVARIPRGFAAFLRISLAALTGAVLLHGSVYVAGAFGELKTWLTVFAIALAGALLVWVWGLLIRFDQRVTGVSVPLALSEAVVGGGLAVMLNGYIAGGEAALPPAAAVAGAALASAAISRHYAAHGMIGIALVALFGLLFIGRFFGALPTWQAALVFLAPLLCWATELRMLRFKTPWRGVALRLGLVAVPLFVVLAFATRDFNRKMSPLLTGVSRWCPNSVLLAHTNPKR